MTIDSISKGPRQSVKFAACVALCCVAMMLAGCKEDRKPEPKIEAAPAAKADAGPLQAQHDALDKAKGVEAQVQAQGDARQKAIADATK